jgi:predicted enzyme related to lactoylglutathione lyase
VALGDCLGDASVAQIAGTARLVRPERVGFGLDNVAGVITGAHAIIFTNDPVRVRTFLRDVLGLPSVDAGGGWPIFALPPTELAAHPSDDPHHEMYLMCDDIHSTVDQLKAKGVEFTRPVTDAGWGLITALELPGGGELALYEPRHPRPPVFGS